ncbi:MAG: radical SAM protein [uncultured bacterium (gcode 4)]|uniref:Radical SAM protein n=1 Tax=uncultured bacterium (gcode 4) TaxID=1234023 RepID=K2G3Q2_9BACT|nr:MAG: radical SAM protein [uncultured bacterium (gcode 4)]
MNRPDEQWHEMPWAVESSENFVGTIVRWTKELTHEITGKCTLNCIHCSTQANPERWDYADFDAFCRNIEEFSEFDMVRLSWWEPFHHPDIVRMVDFLHENWRKIEILSSWTVDKKPIPREILEQMKGKISGIIFSMHGYFEDHHHIVNPYFDFWHPYWDDMMDSVEECADLWIPFSFQAVVMKQNADKLEEIVKCVAMLNKIYKNEITRGKLPKIKMHFLRYIKQWRWLENEVESPDKAFLDNLPNYFSRMQADYSIEISYSSNFEFKDCDCSSKKMVICADWSIIACSALKWAKPDSWRRFACIPRL